MVQCRFLGVLPQLLKDEAQEVADATPLVSLAVVLRGVGGHGEGLKLMQPVHPVHSTCALAHGRPLFCSEEGSKIRRPLYSGRRAVFQSPP